MAALQVVSRPEGSETLEIHEENIKSIFLDPDVRTLPLMVIAIAGDSRHGKSFLFSLLLRYLIKNGGQDWLDGDNNEQLRGFKFGGGTETCTLGIWMWSKPFKVTTKKNEEVAIILVDTQGSFDSSQTIDIVTKFFAFSTLLSSVLIFNAPFHINEDYLGNLNLFTVYARSANNLKDNNNKLQKLIFLIRNWQSSNLLGCTAGNDYVNGKLSDQPNNEEGNKLRRMLKSTFNDCNGCLLPRPCDAVCSCDYNGNIRDIDQHFKQYVEEFFHSILDDANIVKKKNVFKIGANKWMTGEQMVSYIRIICTSLNKMKKMENIFECNVRSSNEIAIKDAEETYKKEMNIATKYGKMYLKKPKLDAAHNAACAKAHQTFLNTSKINGNIGNEKYVNDLNENLKTLYSQLQVDNFFVIKKERERVGIGLAVGGFFCAAGGIATQYGVLAGVVLPVLGPIALGVGAVGVGLGIIGITVVKSVKHFHPDGPESLKDSLQQLWRNRKRCVNPVTENLGSPPTYEAATSGAEKPLITTANPSVNVNAAQLSSYEAATSAAENHTENPLTAENMADADQEQFEENQNRYYDSLNQNGSYDVKTVINYVLFAIVLCFCFHYFASSDNSSGIPSVDLKIAFFTGFIAVLITFLYNYLIK